MHAAGKRGRLEHVPFYDDADRQCNYLAGSFACLLNLGALVMELEFGP